MVTQHLLAQAETFTQPTQPPVRAGGIDRFLETYCPPEGLPILKAAFDREPLREVNLAHGKVLCHRGDDAHEFWIIESGEITVSKDSHLIGRRAGELVGEAFLYRLGENGQAINFRGATLTAYGSTRLYKLDQVFLARMSDAERALWHEIMARVLTAKLDEATDQRDSLNQERWSTEALVDRFVSTDAREAVCAAFRAGGFVRQIDAEACDAVVWFSDVAGFSAYASTLPPNRSGRVIRRIMDIQSTAIQEAGGQIDKYMGDGLLAYWRAPDPERLALSAARAVAAATDCARLLAEHFGSEALPCDIRIGLHCGPVILGDFGGGERVAFTLIGEAVNSASRYEQARTCVDGRPLGRVRASPEVFRHVQAPAVIGVFEPTPRTFADKHGTRFVTHVTSTEITP